MEKHKFFKKPSSRIVLRYCSIAAIFLITSALLIPTLLNYAPGSINTNFDIKMSYISYTQQFLIIGLVILSLIFISTKLLLQGIDNWYVNRNKFSNNATIQAIRKKCFNLPYIIFLFETILPALGITSVIFFTGSHHTIMILKVLVLVFSFTFLLAVFTFIFSKDLYAEILSKTYKEGLNIGLRVDLKNKIIIQILPVFITVLLITSFIGYSTSVKEKEDIIFTVYNEKLTDAFDTNKTYTLSEAKEILKNIKLYNENDSKFILLHDNVIKVSGENPSDFLVDYTLELSSKYNGRTYDSYGVDTQGATIKLETTEGTAYICITYNISSNDTFKLLLLDFIALFIICIFVLIYFSKSLSKDITIVTNGLNDICSSNNTNYRRKLPVISNDEFGDLVQAFNKVQKLNDTQLTQIKDSQDTLMEQERLASLGQLIGGIAHNLKTPIMSISGAAEGLTDLVKEYDSSIDDPEVNSNDHHEIANDMNKWISKIKTHTEYMSDIITAVKGQAVALSNEEDISFTVGELFKRVDILMKHELKSAIIYLNIAMKTDENTVIHGDVNSLVQVINNMISNAIQAYNGKTDEHIDIIVERNENNLLIKVKDYAGGLPEKVKNKLFKEMITTKGKNGTGLGLYMSYSTIRAHFNGNITVESEKDKGTTFTIVLPI